MRPATLAEVTFALGAGGAGTDPVRSALVRGASIDSRTTRAGELFFALSGRVDGAQFAPQAQERGAVAAVATRPLEGVPTLVVRDVLEALQGLARWSLDRPGRPEVVGITGSVGKTTTKDALAGILRSTGGKVCATEGNLNNEIGLPLTVLTADQRTEWLVLEMGATHIGDVAHLCSIAPPRVGVLTAVAPVHLDSFGSVENIAVAKGELARSLPRDGVLVSPLGVPEAALAPGREISRRIVFREERARGAGLWASDVEETDQGLSFTAHLGDLAAPVRAPAFGTHLVAPLLAGMGGALALGVDLAEAATGLSRLRRAGLRGAVYRLRGGITVYDDSYNASPAATVAVLRYGESQARSRGGRFVAVLGGMFELGPGARAYHREVGELATVSGVDLLVCVGEEARWYAEGFAGTTIFAADALSAAEALDRVLEDGDYLVVKGSRGVGLDALTRRLQENLAVV